MQGFGQADFTDFVSHEEARINTNNFGHKGHRERNLDATSLSNCPKLSDNPRILTVEYTVA